LGKKGRLTFENQAMVIWGFWLHVYSQTNMRSNAGTEVNGKDDD
jgi:hypothetical protein